MSRPDPAAGVFETLLAVDGRPVAVDAHLARLAASVRSLYGAEVAETDLARRVSDALTLTTGLFRVRIDYRPGDRRPFTVTATALEERPREPWHLVVRRVSGGWGEHKWLDRTLLQSWTDPRDLAVDPLLTDEGDGILETGRGNVFVVRNGLVATPPLDRRILPGVTRAEVVRLLARLGITCEERAVGLTEMAAADEVFVTNAIGGVRPVASCRDVGSWTTDLPGPVTRAVDQALENDWACDDA
jgi:para-aminobenzoate synthetase/4-amino-4-deoxychorismate lyase